MDRRDLLRGLAILVLAAGSAVRSTAYQPDRSVILEGSLEVLIEDQKERSRILYFLVTEKERIPLRFREHPPRWTTGTRVRVRGEWQTDHVLLVSGIDRL
jgi:hypothetical protein